jgi:hypothetical protein
MVIELVERWVVMVKDTTLSAIGCARQSGQREHVAGAEDAKSEMDRDDHSLSLTLQDRSAD